MDLDLELEQAIAEEDKPPSTPPRPATAWRVAVITTSRGETDRLTQRQIAGAETDRQPNLATVFTALRQSGLKPVAIPANADLLSALTDARPDLCLTLNPGAGTPAQAAQLATLLEMLGLPFTGSRPVAQALAADPALRRALWQQAGLPVAHSRIQTGPRFLTLVLGNRANSGAPRSSAFPQRCAADGFCRLPVWRLDNRQMTVTGMAAEQTAAAQMLAIRAHQAIGALDYSLVQLTLGSEGEPRLLSIQTQPDLTPNGAAARLAAAGGWRYAELLSEILTLGGARFGVSVPRPIFRAVRPPLAISARRLAPVSLR